MKKYNIISSILIVVSLAILPLFGGCDQIDEIVDQGSSLLSGSENSENEGGHYTSVEDRGITLDEYFGGKDYFFYKKTNGVTITPISGDCPPASTAPRYIENEDCFFCTESSEVHEDTNTIIAHISPVSAADFFGSCATKTEFTWPNELTITEKTPDKLVAEGHGEGKLEKSGENCENYSYTYTTDETWIFTTERLQDTSIATVTSTSPTLVFSAPGWGLSQPSPRPYSEYSITVSVSSPYGFKVFPGIKAIKANGRDLNEDPMEYSYNRVKINDTTYSYTFACQYNGEYTVVGVCNTYGKNGALIGETYSDVAYTIQVTDSPEGALPDIYYAQP